MQQPQTPQTGPAGYAWEKFFECLQQNYETPTLIWNGSLRYELIFAIGQELAEFDKEKVFTSNKNHTHGQEMNPNKKYIWNFEEFTIKYMSIANELKVGNYYINILLKRLPNVTVLFPANFQNSSPRLPTQLYFWKNYFTG
jgi:DnaJ family protein C protein 13